MVEKKIDFHYVSPAPVKKESVPKNTKDIKPMDKKPDGQKKPDKKPMDKGGIDHMPLAMAYVPMQKWKNIYDADVGLERGTIFQDLDLPFIGEELSK